MQLPCSVLLAALLPFSWGIHTEAPVAKCKDPMPSIPDFNYSQIEGTEYEYIYTPDVGLYHLVDNINMILRKTAEPKVYNEDIYAKTKFGTEQDRQFQTEDVGNGVLKKTTGGLVYYVSLVSVVGELGLLYVCSDDAGKDDAYDSLYVMSRKAKNLRTAQDPSVVFKEAFDKYDFNARFHKLPRHIHTPSRTLSGHN